MKNRNKIFAGAWLAAVLIPFTGITIESRRVSALEPEFVALFNPQSLETPESVATDFFGNQYISMALTGEIRKIDADGNQSTHAQLPLGAPLTFCGEFPNIMGALAIDIFGNIYVNVNACEPENRGVYKVEPGGEIELLANFPLDSAGNGIALRLGKLYVADTLKGLLYRLDKNGGPLEVWADHPLLERVPAPFGAPGPNGVQFYKHELFVANSSTAQIIAFPLHLNGSAGVPRVHAQLSIGCDDFSFDIQGAIYCTTDPFNTVVKVSPDGEEEAVLLTAADGLDGPTATAFGRFGDRNSLYITNAAFPFFPSNFTPSLIRVDVEIPGYPFR